jgi:DNA-binding CsgD family transcriptional regulator
MQKKLPNLLQEHAFIFKQHQCYVSKQDYENFDEKMCSYLKIWNIEQGMYSVCDLKQQRFLHVSQKLKNLLGFEDNIEWHPGSVTGIYALIHPDDLPVVLETEIMLHHYLRNLHPVEKLNYKLVYDFRIRDCKSRYLRFVHRLLILENDKYGNSWLALLISDLLSFNASDGIPRRFLINTQTSEFKLFSNDINPKSLKLLTQREQEILLFISHGLDTATISEMLFISICTVNNHRQNILSKLKTNNMTMAVNYARIIGCI